MNSFQKHISYSVLDLALISEGKTAAETLEKSLALAQAVEQYGYTRFWLAEHHNSITIASAATSILIGYIASGTSTIRVGSGGIMLPNHSPLIVAEQFGTLGSLYPERIDLGLGRAPGTDQDTAMAIRPDRMRATVQFPQEVAKIQRYFSTDNGRAKVRANVAEGVQVPLYILGSSTDSAHVAAEKGLPYAFASHFATYQLQEAIEIYRREFKPSDVLKEPYVMVAANIIAMETQEAAEANYTTLVRMFLGIMTGNREYVQPPMKMNEDLQELSKNPSLQQMLKYSFVGDKQKVKDQVADFLNMTQADEIIGVTNIYGAEDRKTSYRIFSEIMKELNE